MWKAVGCALQFDNPLLPDLLLLPDTGTVILTLRATDMTVFPRNAVGSWVNRGTAHTVMLGRSCAH